MYQPANDRPWLGSKDAEYLVAWVLGIDDLYPRRFEMVSFSGDRLLCGKEPALFALLK